MSDKIKKLQLHGTMSVDIPHFNLVDLGLPTISFDGSMAEIQDVDSDTTGRICSAVKDGLASFTVNTELGELKMIPIAISESGVTRLIMPATEGSLFNAICVTIDDTVISARMCDYDLLCTVTLSEDETSADYASTDIYNYVQTKYRIELTDYNKTWCCSLKSCTQDRAEFVRSTDDGVDIMYIIDSTGQVTVNEVEAVGEDVVTKYTEDIYDINTCTTGYVTNAGNYTNDSNYILTDYIHVPSGTSVAINGRPRFVCVYDSDKQVVTAEGISSATTNPVLTAPADSDRYLRISFRISDNTASTPIITRTSIPSNYVRTTIDPTVPLHSDHLIGCIEKHETNLLKSTYLYPNSRVSSTGHLTVMSGYNSTDFIDVDPGDSLAFAGRYRDLMVYDQNKSPITTAFVTGNQDNFIYTNDDAEVRYIRVSYQIGVSITEHNMIVRGDTIPTYTEYTTYLPDDILLGERHLQQVQGGAQYLYRNALTGKKWVACGDSFTEGAYSDSPTDDYIFEDGLYAGKMKTYPFFIGRRCGVNVINEAMGGTGITYTGNYDPVTDTDGQEWAVPHAFSADDAQNQTYNGKISRYKAIPADADYITLKFGINDANGRNAILGTIDDETNETFYGAWNIVMRYLITNHPFAKIGIIISNGLSGGLNEVTGHTTQEFAEATRQIAVKWGVPYLDEDSGIQVPMLNRTNREGVCDEVKELRENAFTVLRHTNNHPNAKAHEYESYFVENWLLSL